MQSAYYHGKTARFRAETPDLLGVVVQATVSHYRLCFLSAYLLV